MDKKSSGFPLIELIVVDAIFGILAVVAVPRLAGVGKHGGRKIVCR